ncbi:MAG TPA: GAF domain-containing SpoIIE family protein phosphatase [Candidatus Polarisedimenticolia bacterium]|nr:GAF domain-containing SpoIIE family protein phosphatase [Candidatus Polarisedimenticolia bacterium]
MGQEKVRSSPTAEAMERILSVTRELARPLDLNTTLSHVIDAARAVLDADRGSVFLYDPKTHELTTTVATGVTALRFPANRGIIGECAERRAVINVPDCYNDPRFNREADQKTGYRTRCLLTVPLIGYDNSLVGVMQVLNKREGVFSEEDESIATALAAQCAVAIQRTQMLMELVENEKLKQELSVARDIQARVLPKAVPRLAGYDLAGWSRPANETGGDIFDIIAMDGNRLMLLLGDATGHGVGPALSVTQVRAMLRMAVRLGSDLDSAFRHINDQLVDDLPDNRFVTAFLGLLDTEKHRVIYHAGGQGPLLHFHAQSGTCEWMEASTVPMGFMAGLPLPEARSHDLGPGDILGLITDGIFEYENPQEEAFGKERVARLVQEHQGDPMARLLERIVAEVERFCGPVPQADDMTMLLVRRLPR